MAARALLGPSALAAALLVLLSGCAPASPPAIASAGEPFDRWSGGVPAGYALLWSDEFDSGSMPDTAKWGYDTSRNREGWWNDERQYYSAARPENSRIADGRLLIEARKEDFAKDKPADHGGQAYTSARMTTAGKGRWTYGFVEVRAKLPCGRGTWPAIWMLPEPPSEGWPAGGEIDIMEHVGQDPGTVHANIHTRAYNHVARTNLGAQIKVANPCTEFHRYQLLWTASGLAVAVDDRPYFRFANDGRGDRSSWPYDRPFHLILNVAIGGWGGQQGIDDAIFPVRMEVDYVRVYQPH